jgi:UDP-N-acetylglucosamine 4,6-dehydratase
MNILITGGAGFLGRALTLKLLKSNSDCVIRIYSRDELKHWEFRNLLDKQGFADRVRFFIGDVRDRERLIRACEGVHTVIHCAALKHIESGEYNPQEAVKTNIYGTSNVIDACIANKVRSCCLVSSDKAVNPSCLYGATKYASEKLWLNANHIKGNREMCFWGVRFGNLKDSTGSVWCRFEELRQRYGRGTTYPITDDRMTRFVIGVIEASEFICQRLVTDKSVVYVPKMHSVRIADIPYDYDKDAKIEIIGLRDGEKLHEETVSINELAEEHETYWIVGNVPGATLGNSVKSGQ